jgi:hypothetical protein
MIPQRQIPIIDAARATLKNRPSVSAAQVSMLRNLVPDPTSLATNVDQQTVLSTFIPVKLRQVRTKLSRLNLNKAAREAVALKEQFRREDRELAAQGRHAEIWARNRRLMGIKDGERLRLIGFGGARFE